MISKISLYTTEISKIFYSIICVRIFKNENIIAIVLNFYLILLGTNPAICSEIPRNIPIDGISLGMDGLAVSEILKRHGYAVDIETSTCPAIRHIVNGELVPPEYPYLPYDFPLRTGNPNSCIRAITANKDHNKVEVRFGDTRQEPFEKMVANSIKKTKFAQDNHFKEIDKILDSLIKRYGDPSRRLAHAASWCCEASDGHWSFSVYDSGGGLDDYKKEIGNNSANIIFVEMNHDLVLIDEMYSFVK